MTTTPAMPPRGQDRGNRAGMAAVIVASGLAILALVGGLVAAANSIDSLSARHEEQLVENGLKLKDTALRDCITPNTMWDDAVAHLDNRFDTAWADTNMGQYLTTTCSVSQVYVLNADGRVLAGWRDGKPASAAVPAPLQASVAQLVAKIRAREARRGPFSSTQKNGEMIATAIDETTKVATEAGPVVVSASLIQPDFGTALPSGARAPVVVTVQAIDAVFLEWLSSHFLLDSVHVERAPFGKPEPKEASVFLRDAAGGTVARVDWDYRQPARDLAWVAAPPAGLLLLILIIAPAFTILHDRRQRRRLQAAMLAANAASDSKSRFIANMSHEIRTPMNGVVGVLHLLRRKGLDAESRQLIEEALASGALLQGLLNDVLDLSRIESGAFELDAEPLDPEAMIREVVGLFSTQAREKGVALRTSFEGAPGMLMADGLRLRQLCMNLIGNAMKFTARGHVDVRCILTDPTPSGERTLRVEVEDTGIGIPTASQALLFRRFSQADGSIVREFGGSGLGLSICATLVDLMGGDIGFESTEGQGSTFWFQVPLQRVEGCAGATAVAMSEPDDDSAAGLRILVVDDNPTNQKVARMLLEAVGADVETASNGAEGLDAAQASRFDLILMDIQMPVMDGLTATRQIRALGRPLGRVPIIGLTANVLPSQKRDYLAAGMNDVAEKPINPARLIEQIEAALEHASTPDNDALLA